MRKNVILDGAAIERTLGRLAAEVVERHGGTLQNVALVGIRTGGLTLAERLMKGLPGAVLGAIDISLYRDNLFGGLPRPMVGRSELAFDLQAKTIVLVDDVLYTGRTVRAALDAVMDYGRPRAVELLALVDRGHRELPIQANYVGLRAETTRNEVVRVELTEQGAAADAVVVYERKAAKDGETP